MLKHKYIVITDDSGEQKVHTDWCVHVPPDTDHLFLGHFSDCFEAVNAAKALDINATPCYDCCKECRV